MELDDVMVVPEPAIKNGNGDEGDDLERKKEFDAMNEFESSWQDDGGAALQSRELGIGNVGLGALLDNFIK